MHWRLLLILIITLLPANLFAAAWNQEAGKGQLINNFVFYQTNRFHRPNGESVKTGQFTKYEYNPYAEFGVNKDLTIGTSIFADYLRMDTANGLNDGFNVTAADFFARFELYRQGNTVFSVQPLVELPGTYSSRRQDLFGDRQTAGEIRLLGGQGFSYLGQNHFIDVEAAYRARSVSEDEIRIDATLGLRPQERWLALMQAFTTISTDKGSANSFQFNNSNNYNLLKLQLSGVYDYSNSISFQLGGFANTWAENTGGGGGAVFSIWYRF